MRDSTQTTPARHREPGNPPQTQGDDQRTQSDDLPHYWPFLLRPEQAAAALQISRTKIFSLLASGELPSVTIGRSRRIPKDGLIRYIATLKS